MKFSLSWLKDHLDITASVEHITRTPAGRRLGVDGAEECTRTHGFVAAHAIRMLRVKM